MVTQPHPAGDDERLPAVPPYTVYVVIENDIGERRWWVLDHHHDLNEAWDHAIDVTTQEYHRTGIEPALLDA